MVSNNYIPRVTQLDSLQLDEEVIETFKNQLTEITKFLSPGLLTPITPELELSLRYLIHKYSLRKDGRTFGQKMLSLKYNPDTLSSSKLHWLFGYTAVLKYIRERLFLSYASNKRAQSFVLALERFQLIGELINLVRFLQTGKYPTFVEYFLNLEMISERVFRNQYTDYAWTRELLWHSFVELFGVLIPLLNTGYIRRIIREKSFNIFRRKRADFAPFINTIPTITSITYCVECGKNPILPHFMGCKHVFCHYCLQANKLDNPHYKCPKCNFYSTVIMRVPSG